MNGDMALSAEQLEQLNKGESIDVTMDGPGHRRDVTVHPPCEDNGHDWSRHDLRKKQGQPSWSLTRYCSACGETDEVLIGDPDNLFDMARGQ